MFAKHPACRLCVSVSLICVFLLEGSLAADLDNQGSNSEAIAHGRKTFERNCVFCHGPEGTGGKVKALRGSMLTPDQMFQTISNGKIMGGNVMPAWKNSLSVDEIRQLTAYVASLRDSPIQE